MGGQTLEKVMDIPQIIVRARRDHARLRLQGGGQLPPNA
jgi:hypothetical protein